MSNTPGSARGIRGTSRRSLLRGAGAAAAATIAAAGVAPASQRVPGANDRIGVGLTGCGGEGNALMSLVGRLREGGAHVQIVAVCDVYRPRLNKAAQQYAAKVVRFDPAEKKIVL